METLIVVKLVDLLCHLLNVLAIALKDVVRVVLWCLSARINEANNLRFLLLVDPEETFERSNERILRLRRVRLLDSDALISGILLWNLLFWERWGVLQVEPEDFAFSVILVDDVLLRPRGIAEACVGISAQHFVSESVLDLI